MLKKLCCSMAALLLTSNVLAAALQIDKARVRATAPGQENAMLDLQMSSSQAARLISVSTPAATSVELHRMSLDNGVMKMRQIKELALPAGQVVDLGEAGLHLMLIGLQAPLQEGTRVPFTLKIQLANKKILSVDATAQVTPLVESKPDADMDAHQHMHHH